MMRVSNPTTESSTVPKEPVARLVGHDGPIETVRFTGDGKYCVTGGTDRTVRLWNPARYDPAFYNETSFKRKKVRISGDGKAVDAPIQSLPRALPIQIYKDGITHGVTALAVDETARTLAVASGRTLTILDVVSQKCQRRLGHAFHTARINAVAVSQNAETVLTASYDATVCIWDMRNSNSRTPIQVLREAKDSVTDIHVVQSDCDMALIRTASVDGVIRTYDLRMGLIRCDDCDCPITRMALSSDSKCVVLSGLDGYIRLMDADSGELLNTYESHHTAGKYSLDCAFTADDAMVVTGSEDGRAVFYDAVTADAVQVLLGHSGPTCSISVHPKVEKRSTIVTASYDGHAVVWASSSYDFMQE